jgi:hypothetical protein
MRAPVRFDNAGRFGDSLFDPFGYKTSLIFG